MVRECVFQVKRQIASLAYALLCHNRLMQMVMVKQIFPLRHRFLLGDDCVVVEVEICGV